jgi:hypothetical protein
MKHKTLTYTFLLASLAPAVMADDGDMMSGMMMGGGVYGMGVLGFVYFALAAFIFSIIFWATHNWLVKGKKR